MFNKRICSEHFVNSDYKHDQIHKNTRKRLIHGAVLSKNLPQENENMESDMYTQIMYIVIKIRIGKKINDKMFFLPRDFQSISS